jgi:hypothetical protein
MGSKIDNLKWDAAHGAVKYNVYSDDKLIGTVTLPSFTVDSTKFVASRFYTVTAVDANGMESMASPPCLAAGGTGYGDPNQPPQGAPTGKARGEWNNGAGRIIFEWNWTGGKASFWGNQFKVWRDGTLVADNLSTFYYIDNNPGTAQHTYEVAVLAAGKEGPRSNAATGTAPGHGPATGGQLLIVNTIPNDSSMKIILATYPGALDYRAYEEGHPDRCKYAGKGSLTIEVNNINPTSPPKFIVEALDKLGPFMPMDGTSNPQDPFVSRATRPMPAGMFIHANGHGDPSNVPNVIATSSPTPANLKTKTLPGKQVFLDTFRTFNPLVQSATVDPDILEYDPYVMGSKPNTAKNPYIKEFKNDKWRMMMFICNAQDTKLFGMSRHFMDTVYDGGVPGGGPEGDSTPPHNNNSTTTFEPLAAGNLIPFDFSNGRVLHLTMEVDPHFTPRRWCDMGIYPAGDSLTDPALQKLDLPHLEAATLSGNIFCWEIMADLVNIRQFIGDGSNTAKVKASGGYQNGVDTSYPGDHGGPAERGPNGKFKLNGTQGDLDNRHTFDMYTDGKRVVIVEEHNVLKDTKVPVPLTYTKAHVFFSHHVYHIVNELSEAARRGNEPYFTNYAQMKDERHWNNMGAEVLDQWPTQF